MTAAGHWRAAPALDSPAKGGMGPSGSEATPPLAGHHYDGAREIITERSRGMATYADFEVRSTFGIERRDLS